MVARSALLGALLVAVTPLVLSASAARADELALDASDVASVFHIAKSENKNQVHFAARLDERCALSGDEPILAYWRDREVSASATSELLFLERPAYDVGEVQRLGPYRARFVLRGFADWLLELQTSRGEEGRCAAQVIGLVGGEPARIREVFVQLSGWSVDYAVVRADRLRDGVLIETRVRR